MRGKSGGTAGPDSHAHKPKIATPRCGATNSTCNMLNLTLVAGGFAALPVLHPISQKNDLQGLACKAR